MRGQHPRLGQSFLYCLPVRTCIDAAILFAFLCHNSILTYNFSLIFSLILRTQGRTVLDLVANFRGCLALLYQGFSAAMPSICLSTLPEDAVFLILSFLPSADAATLLATFSRRLMASFTRLGALLRVSLLKSDTRLQRAYVNFLLRSIKTPIQVEIGEDAFLRPSTLHALMAARPTSVQLNRGMLRTSDYLPCTKLLRIEELEQQLPDLLLKDVAVLSADDHFTLARLKEFLGSHKEDAFMILDSVIAYTQEQSMPIIALMFPRLATLSFRCLPWEIIEKSSPSVSQAACTDMILHTLPATLMQLESVFPLPMSLPSSLTSLRIMSRDTTFSEHLSPGWNLLRLKEKLPKLRNFTCRLPSYRYTEPADHSSLDFNTIWPIDLESLDVQPASILLWPETFKFPSTLNSLALLDDDDDLDYDLEDFMEDGDKETPVRSDLTRATRVEKALQGVTNLISFTCGVHLLPLLSPISTCRNIFEKLERLEIVETLHQAHEKQIMQSLVPGPDEAFSAPILPLCPNLTILKMPHNNLKKSRHLLTELRHLAFLEFLAESVSEAAEMTVRLHKCIIRCSHALPLNSKAFQLLQTTHNAPITKIDRFCLQNTLGKLFDYRCQCLVALVHDAKWGWNYGDITESEAVELNMVSLPDDWSRFALSLPSTVTCVDLLNDYRHETSQSSSTSQNSTPASSTASTRIEKEVSSSEIAISSFTAPTAPPRLRFGISINFSGTSLEAMSAATELRILKLEGGAVVRIIPHLPNLTHLDLGSSPLHSILDFVSLPSTLKYFRAVGRCDVRGTSPRIRLPVEAMQLRTAILPHIALAKLDNLLRHCSRHSTILECTVLSEAEAMPDNLSLRARFPCAAFRILRPRSQDSTDYSLHVLDMAE